MTRESGAGAIEHALRSGASGLAAMAAQVTGLMWLRTTINHQYRHGGTGLATLRALHREGGVPRLYRGYAAAMLQAPLSRFGDTACYTAARRWGDDREGTPVWQTTAVASLGSSLWRLGLMPLDSLKTSMQVHGKSGGAVLRQKIRVAGPGVLYHGYLGTAGATMLGYYPWFFTFGYLDRVLPPADPERPVAGLCRHAGMGFGASLVSDTVSNAARVTKTYRQTHPTPISYADAARRMIASDGWRGWLGRGLRTKWAANGIQSATFAVAWKHLESRLSAGDESRREQ